LPSKSHHLAILGFGLLGIATALGSYGSVVLFPPALVRYESFPPPEFPYLQIGDAPILPGLIFGLLVAACAYRFAVRDRFLLCVVVFFTALGWIAAVNSSVAAVDYLLLLKSRSSVIQPDTARSDTSERDASQSDTTQPEVPNQDVAPPGRPDRSGHLSLPDRPTLFVGGIVGGFVGGFFILFGLSTANPSFRNLDHWSMPLFIATILGGAVLAIGFEKLGWLFIFAGWQPPVSASIARELARARA
jgi:hypothetical protein